MSKAKTRARSRQKQKKAARPNICDLSGDELSIALGAVEFMAVDWKLRKKSGTKFERDSIRAINALRAKLQFIFDQAYPHDLVRCTGAPMGHEVIMRLDFREIRRMNAARRAALKPDQGRACKDSSLVAWGTHLLGGKKPTLSPKRKRSRK